MEWRGQRGDGAKWRQDGGEMTKWRGNGYGKSDVGREM